MTTFEPHETDHYAPQRRVPVFWIVTIGLLVTLLAAGIRVNNILPASVPLIGMDSGVAVCKAIDETGEAVGQAPVAATDLDKIREIRAMFADSRYEDIRLNGVAMMDLSAQFVQMQGDPADSDLGTALALVGPMMTANAGLAGGCREHGYEIPALGGKDN